MALRTRNENSPPIYQIQTQWFNSFKHKITIINLATYRKRKKEYKPEELRNPWEILMQFLLWYKTGWKFLNSTFTQCLFFCYRTLLLLLLRKYSKSKKLSKSLKFRPLSSPVFRIPHSFLIAFYSLLCFFRRVSSFSWISSTAPWALPRSSKIFLFFFLRSF